MALPSTDLIQQVVDSIPSAVIAIDTSYQIQFVNEAFITEFKEILNLATYRGLNLQDVLSQHPDWLQQTQPGWENAFSGNHHARVVEIPAPPAATTPKAYYEATFAPLRAENGAVSGAISVRRDIADSRFYGDRVAKLVQKALKAMSVSLFYQNRDFVYMWAYVPNLPVEPEDIVGQTDTVLFDNNEDEAQLRELKQRVIDTGEPQSIVAAAVINGTSFKLDMLVAPLRGAFQEIIGVIVTAVDVTTDMKQDDQMALLKAELERERELIRMREQFINMATHDLRTPLTVISTSQQILSDMYEMLNDESRHRHLMKIGHQAAHMTEMLNEIALFDKVRRGEVVMARKRLNVVTYCQELMEDVWATHTTTCEPCFTYPSEELTLSINERLLNRVLINLLTNAVKYSPNGGKVCLNIAVEASDLVFVVSDEGMGIPTTDLPHIFKPFRRASNATRSEINGTGLGMAIVKLSVEQHNGTVTVTSTPGQGTTVTVRLPILDEGV